MDEQDTNTKSFDQSIASIMAAAVVSVMVIFLGAVGIYLYHFGRLDISKDPAQWGPFGDYLGGVINPAVGLATVVLVVTSISIQRRELRASIAEMQAANQAAKRMSLEQSLFAWLENYHSQIRDIEQGNYKGRKVLLHLYQQCLSPSKTVHSNGIYPDSDEEANQRYIRLNVPGQQGLKALGQRQLHATLAYQRLYQTHKSDLDAPFRTLYRLIRWIDSSELTDEQKWHYCTLVRSQLSWPELVFLYYNGLIKEGEKLAIYANKYALFDNILARDELIRFATDELTKCPSKERPQSRDGKAPWPYETSAFDSREAKKKLNLALTT